MDYSKVQHRLAMWAIERSSALSVMLGSTVEDQQIVGVTEAIQRLSTAVNCTFTLGVTLG